MNKNKMFSRAIVFLIIIMLFGLAYYTWIIEIDKSLKNNIKFIIAYFAFSIGNAGSITNWLFSLFNALFAQPDIHLSLSTIPGKKDLECDITFYNGTETPLKLESVTCNEYAPLVIEHTIPPKQSYEIKKQLLKYNNSNSELSSVEKLTFTFLYRLLDSSKSKEKRKNKNNPFHSKKGR